VDFQLFLTLPVLVVAFWWRRWAGYALTLGLTVASIIYAWVLAYQQVMMMMMMMMMMMTMTMTMMMSLFGGGCACRWSLAWQSACLMWS
jgi:hypothetical protein